MTYELTLDTARAILSARREQTGAARSAIKSINSRKPRHYWQSRRLTSTEPHAVTHWARVRFVNGTVTEGLIHATLLRDWIALGKRKRVSMTLSPTAFRLSRDSETGTSSITFYIKDEINTGRSYSRRKVVPFAAVGAPIVLVAPPEGGEFVVSHSLPLP